MDVSVLTQSLADYNSRALAVSDMVIAALTPMAYVLAAVFFAIEFDNFNRKFTQNGGTMTLMIALEQYYKYIVAVVLIANAGMVFDFIMALGEGATKLVSGVGTTEAYELTMKLGKVGGISKAIISFFAGITEYVTKVSVNIIVMMRFLHLYLFRSLSPLILAFYMADVTRPIAISFLKSVGAAALQTAVLILIIRLYPAIVTNDIMTVELSDGLSKMATAFTSIGKGIIFIIMIWGSQKMAKTLINAM